MSGGSQTLDSGGPGATLGAPMSPGMSGGQAAGVLGQSNMPPWLKGLQLGQQIVQQQQGMRPPMQGQQPMQRPMMGSMPGGMPGGMPQGAVPGTQGMQPPMMGQPQPFGGMNGINPQILQMLMRRGGQ